MGVSENWPVPSRETYEWTVYLFQFFPLVTLLQWIPWIQPFYATGKTSNNSIFNIPGKVAWITMEVPGFLLLLYIMNTLPATLGIKELPLENKILGGLFVIHYLYRAILSPLLNPSMSPTIVLVWAWAVVFQVANGLSIGCWLSGYGPTTSSAWKHSTSGSPPTSTSTLTLTLTLNFPLGILIWALGLLGNIYHDDALREIRRSALRKQRAEQRAQDQSTGKDKPKGKSHSVEKVYMIPEKGLFRWVLYPHYLCEWVEWAGFWLAAGVGCLPARTFLVNEVTTMLARAVEGRAWYVKKFGREKVGRRRAVIPGLV